jgi:hypothetical protein
VALRACGSFGMLHYCRTAFARPEKPLHVIRRADEQSAAAIARLLRLVLRTSLPFLPELHTPDEDIWFVRNVMFAQCEVWVAEANDVDGFIAFRRAGSISSTCGRDGSAKASARHSSGKR